MEYFEGINDPEISIEGYLCDRCQSQPLTEEEYNKNRKNGFIYCNECFTYIGLQKAKCIYCGNSWTGRSERILPFECECGGLVVCLTK